MSTPLKDMVDSAVIRDIADRFAAESSEFDSASFAKDLEELLPNLELKPRMEAIARRLRDGLPTDYRKALDVVLAVAKAEPGIEGFAAWPLCTFVEIFGVGDPAVSLPAMEHLTKRASCEFAIRPFLRDHWEAAYGTLMEFTDHDDPDVRRLPSEGSRPRLPWGMRVHRLIDDPEPGLALIERLRHDPSETVRRSVANHLNDVAKDHPDIVTATVKRWAAEPESDGKMISHALRTLVKQGKSEAMQVLGFTSDAALDLVSFSVQPTSVVMGDRIELVAELRSTSDDPQRLVVDFVVHHVTAAGSTSPKVFKWTTMNLAAREAATITKRRLIQIASTRTYHPGQHRVELQVAGKVIGETAFEVVV